MDNDTDHDSEPQSQDTEMHIDRPIMTSPSQDNAVPGTTTGTAIASTQPLSGLSRLFGGEARDEGAVLGVLEASIPYAPTLVGEDLSSSSVTASSSSSSSPGKHTIPFAEESPPKRPTNFLPPDPSLPPQPASLIPSMRPN